MQKILDSWGNPALLVVGDLMLDQYLWGKVDRISPEAPIQVLSVTREEYRLGGAANVAANLRELGARVALAGVVGDDEGGRTLRRLLEARGIPGDLVRTDPARPTTLKTRMVAQTQQVLRVDREETSPLPEAALREWRDALSPALATADLAILSDYGKGVLSREMLSWVIARCRQEKKRVLVDPKGRDYDKYRGVSLITPNRHEAELAWGREIITDADLEQAGKYFVSALDLEAVIITLGKDGMYLYERSGRSRRVKTEAREVYDVTGAGDTALATLGYALTQGWSWARAMEISNLAAGVAVGKSGVATVSREELRHAFSRAADRSGHKALPLEALLPRLEKERARGRQIVFTNGCFDLLHAGHVSYLRFARSAGDLLVVGLNSDESVRRLKGEGHPVFAAEDRARVLSALEDVDYVVIFGEDTPQHLIGQVAPDVLIKGEDWKEKGVVGREFVEGRGGQVLLAPLVPGTSTTRAIERILERFGGKRNSGR